MTEPLYGVLVLMPLFLAIGASAFVWRRISRPWLFLVTSVLTMFGLQGIAVPVAVSYFLPSDVAPVPNPVFDRGLLLSVAIEVLLGVPFLLWLSRGLRKA